jgi:Family of unknown function (DUF695)
MANAIGRLSRLIGLLVALGMMVSPHGTIAFADTWATAVSKNAAGNRAIIFRFKKDFAAGFDRLSQPDCVILVWKYRSDRGMPPKEERVSMDAMEDLLQPLEESNGFATLAIVSTGEDLREWTYYTASESDFIKRMNQLLAGNPRFPIEIHSGPDPTWQSYETFRKTVRE